MEPCTSWTSEWYDIRLVFGREIGREEGGDEERQKRVEETRLWYTRTAPHVRRTFHFWLFLMPITNWLRLTSKCRSETKWCDFRIESKSPRSHFDSTATLLLISVCVSSLVYPHKRPASGNFGPYLFVVLSRPEERRSRRWIRRRLSDV